MLQGNLLTEWAHHEGLLDMGLGNYRGLAI